MSLKKDLKNTQNTYSKKIDNVVASSSGNHPQMHAAAALKTPAISYLDAYNTMIAVRFIYVLVKLAW